MAFKTLARVPNRMPLGRDIRISKSGMPIGSIAYRELGSPERITIMYDTEELLIKLVPSNFDNGQKVAPTPAPHITTKFISRVMPIGRYNYVEPGIFKLEA